MRKSRRPIAIASRTSPLARAQAQLIGAMLARANPGLAIEYRWIESEGDQRTESPLSAVGGKGLFVRAIELAILHREADLAVHSLKDLPSRPEETGVGHQLTLAAIPRRADPHDCLVSAAGFSSLKDLPPGGRLGTASPRRAAQVLRLRPDLHLELLRGNVQTRLRKVLDEKHFDATLLAAAGLARLNLPQHAVHPLPFDEILPPGGQGALALQCRPDDHVTLLRCVPLNDALTATAVHVERQVLAALHGDCHSSIAALAEPDPEHRRLRLRVRVLSPDGSQCIDTDDTGPLDKPGKLVKTALAALAERKVRDLLGS